MRNVLVFPDGTEQDFMYPPDRDVTVGEKLVLQMTDNSEHHFVVAEIVHEAKRILYKLSY